MVVKKQNVCWKKNRMCVVEGSNSPNSTSQSPNQNHPRHSNSKSKTEIEFPVTILTYPTKTERQYHRQSLATSTIALHLIDVFNIIIIIGK